MELRQFEDSNTKTLNELARVNEELKREKEFINRIEREKRSLEQNVGEIQERYDDLENSFHKNEKKVSQRLETRIAALELELESEQKHRHETEKNLRKQERLVKDMIMQAEEDKKTQEKLYESIEELNRRLRVYKQQLEDSVNIVEVFC